MTDRYLSSVAGNDTNDGLTWATSKATMVNVMSTAAPGDTIYVAHNHNESGAGMTIAGTGTVALPIRVVCATNGGTQPPTAVATTGVVTSTSTIFDNGGGYIYGMTYKPGSGGSVTQSFNAGGTIANSNRQYENCSFQLLTTGTGLAQIIFGDETRSDSVHYRLRNCTMKFGGVNQRIKLGGGFRWEGGSFVTGTTAPVNVFQTSLRGTDEFTVAGVDFTNASMGTSFNLLIQNAGGNACHAMFRNCLLPSGWTGGLWSATPTAPWIRAMLLNCFIGSTKVRYWMHDFMGQVRDNTTIVRTGGATDDTTQFSMKMASSADTEYPIYALESAPIKVWVDATTTQTVYVEVVHDSQGSGSGAALRDDEITVKAVGPGGTVENIKATFLTTPSDHATSTATWVTTGLTTPVKQKLAVSFTPTSKGVWILTVMLYAASKTVYYCPKVT